MKKNFCKGVISFVLTIIVCLSGHAQYKALKVGDKVPEAFWTTQLELVNHPQQSINLSADQDKLIILDFWNIWCSACLVNFPRMEALQKQFEGKIKILAVSQQDRPTLEKFFATKNGHRYKSTISVAGDKIMHQLFPHIGVPYMVWIKDGKVVSTTDVDQVTEKTISEVISNKASSLQTVIQMPTDKPLMLSENFNLEKRSSMLAYSFFSKGRIRSVGYGSFAHRDNATVYGRKWTNLSMESIFRNIAYEIFTKLGDNFSAKRMQVSVREDELFRNKSHIEDNVYSVDYIVPKTMADSLYPRMLNYLNENSNYNARINFKTVKCLVLTMDNAKKVNAQTTAQSDMELIKGIYHFTNVPIDYVINMIDEQLPDNLPVIDETNFHGKMNLKLSIPKNLNVLKKDLADNGFALKEEFRNVRMLLITDKE